MNSSSPLLLDVRDDIRNGREPFSKIMSAASSLEVGEKLLLIAPFEPVPLLHVLNRQGFQHSAHPNQAGDWEVLFVRQSVAQPEVTAQKAIPAEDQQAEPNAGQAAEVDARGLEPPQPMVKILETLATLPADMELRARTDRRPIHLYAQLEQRGFTAQTDEQPDGSFLTQIRRR